MANISVTITPEALEALGLNGLSDWAERHGCALVSTPRGLELQTREQMRRRMREIRASLAQGQPAPVRRMESRRVDPGTGET